MHLPAAIDALPTVGMTRLLSGPSVGKPTLHRAGCAGLDSSVPSHQGEGTIESGLAIGW